MLVRGEEKCGSPFKLLSAITEGFPVVWTFGAGGRERRFCV